MWRRLPELNAAATSRYQKSDQRSIKSTWGRTRQVWLDFLTDGGGKSLGILPEP